MDGHILHAPISHIYPSVGYCAVYLYQGLSTTFRKINGSQLHTFFLSTYASSGLGCHRTAMTTKHNFRSALSLLLPVIIFAAGCKDMKLDIQDSKDRLDVLEGTTITTINEQITAINSSITDLESMDETLDGYIESLETTATDLQKQINDANAEIAKVKSELGEEISALEQSLLDELNSAKEAILAELSAINKTLDDLRATDAALDKKIADLRTYVDTELASTKDWANATFSTLTQYEQTQTEISGIKASIEQINTDMAALETRLNGKIAADIKTAIDALRIELNADHASRIESAVNNLTVAYTAAVSSARSEITTAYTNAISNAIVESESGMKAWVNTKLTQGYYDIATIDGKLQALSGRLDEADEELQKQIDQQKSDLETAKSELTSAYKKAINDAIQTNNGIISAEFVDAVQKLEAKINSRLSTIESQITAMQKGINEIIDDIDTIQKQIESINTTLGTLENEDQELNSLIDKLQSDYAALLQELEEIKSSDDIFRKRINDDIINLNKLIETILNRLTTIENKFSNRIQSLKYIPEYSDGKVNISKETRSLSLNFIVSPASQAVSIQSSWETKKDNIMACLIYTKDPFTRTSTSEIPLKILNVIGTENGLLNIQIGEKERYVFEDDFIEGNTDGVLYLRIVDDYNDVCSELIHIDNFQEKCNVFISDISATTVTFKGQFVAKNEDLSLAKVLLYYSASENFSIYDEGVLKVDVTEFDENGNFSIVLEGLTFNTVYRFCIIPTIKSQGVDCSFRGVDSFTTNDVTIDVSCDKFVTTIARIKGSVTGISDIDKESLEFGIRYRAPSINVSSTKKTVNLNSDNSFSCSLSSLKIGSGAYYYYSAYILQNGVYTYGREQEFIVQ